MEAPNKQYKLFQSHSFTDKTNLEKLTLSKETILNWQKRISNYQAKLFFRSESEAKQFSLFSTSNQTKENNINPLNLTPLPLSFWRWPNSAHKGPAIYLVMDKPKELPAPLLLYVGETIAADRRWKGVHDCKNYLSAYLEALSYVGLESQLSIRFWMDVPKNTKERRQIEQTMIQKWLPPFNKETRSRWATPFTTF